jgi:hypothetical protein
MRYYRNALKYAGFPHAMYTIGSCFAVLASAYIAVGGMNRRQAGEDFYFLHKLVQYGNVGNIVSTKVYPSSRISDRVPFGTGPALKRWMDGDTSLCSTFPLSLFGELDKLFRLVEGFYLDDFTGLSNNFHFLFSQYLLQTKFVSECKMIRANCSGLKVFKERFFHRFNAFWVLKWLNFATDNGWEKRPLVDESTKLLAVMGVTSVANIVDAKILLCFFRELDKQSSESVTL